MEYVNGIKLRDILLDNGNWWKFFLTHRRLIRTSIIINVLKVLMCGTHFLGYHFFICPKCHKSIKLPHSCKSRFCSYCEKKATDDWIKNSFNTLPDTVWQHITFTMPDLLWDFFWVNRYLINRIPLLAANSIKKLAAQKGLVASQNGGVLNTAFIERLNATFRSCLACLVRRTRHLSRQPKRVEAAVYLVGCVYNFCTYHTSLRLPLYFVQGSRETVRWVQRIPTMAAYLTAHRWSILELLQYKVAPPHRAPT